MDTQKHHVKRVLFELNVSHERDARRLHDALGHIHRTRVVPLLARCFGEAALANGPLRIDSLILDLGALNMDRLAEDLPARLADCLTTALEREATAAQDASSEVVRAQSYLELLETFAGTGCLPWWAETADTGVLEQAVQTLIDTDSRALRQRLPVLLGSATRLARMVRSLDDAALSRLASACFGIDATTLEGDVIGLSRQQAASLSALRPGNTVFRHRIWESVLATAVSNARTAPDPQQLWGQVLEDLTQRLGTSVAALATFLRRHSRGSLSEPLRRAIEAARPPDSAIDEIGVAGPRAKRIASIPRWREVLRRLRHGTGANLTQGDAVQAMVHRLLAAGVPPAPGEDRALCSVLESLRALLEPAQMAALEAVLQRAGEGGSAILDDPRADMQEIYVDNCGLVILWPFLARFFDNLGLLHDHRFEHAAAACRGAALLQYLATGEASGPEFLLPLNKVLCGLEPAHLFEPGNPVFSEQERNEAAHLLEAAIEHASALGSLSVAGFRGSFLLRRGVLGVRDGAWILRAERETFDVLLDRLPWSLALVKLPWMPAPLRMEW